MWPARNSYSQNPYYPEQPNMYPGQPETDYPERQYYARRRRQQYGPEANQYRNPTMNDYEENIEDEESTWDDAGDDAEPAEEYEEMRPVRRNPRARNRNPQYDSEYQESEGTMWPARNYPGPSVAQYRARQYYARRPYGPESIAYRNSTTNDYDEYNEDEESAWDDAGDDAESAERYEEMRQLHRESFRRSRNPRYRDRSMEYYYRNHGMSRNGRSESGDGVQWSMPIGPPCEDEAEDWYSSNRNLEYYYRNQSVSGDGISESGGQCPMHYVPPCEDEAADWDYPSSENAVGHVPAISLKKKKTKNSRNEIIKLEDILEEPGRFDRPEKIAIIMRGLPGSGKSYFANLIKKREVYLGGDEPKVLSIDDYFTVEVVGEGEGGKEGEEKEKEDRKTTYKYNAENEESYMTILIKAFKRTVCDGYYSFVILDCNNELLSTINEPMNYAKQLGFQVYICEMDTNVDVCLKKNIHGRTLSDIQEISSRWQPTSKNQILLDYSYLKRPINIHNGPKQPVPPHHIPPHHVPPHFVYPHHVPPYHIPPHFVPPHHGPPRRVRPPFMLMNRGNPYF